MDRVKELVDILKRANESYRLGDEVMPDETYDKYVDELRSLDPNNKFLDKIGTELMDKERMEELPVQLWSMEKVKTIEELTKWTKSKNIPLSTMVVLSPKYDGISLATLEPERKSWTRGNGMIGQRSHEHFSHLDTNQLTGNIITWGEAIMSRKKFFDNHSDDFKNPRNLVGGKFNDKTPDPEVLKDIEYIRYGMVTDDFNFETKSEQFDYLNETQRSKVPYIKIELGELTEDYLKDLFIEWNVEYELDGIIIEVDSLELREKIGRERNNNPGFARAFKGDFEEVKDSVVLSITTQVSKRGYLKPVVNIEPIELNGVTVTNPTGYNFRFIKEMGIGVGSIVRVKRSGMVIPKIIEVVERVDFEMPDIGVPIKWNESGVELITTEMTDTQRMKQIESFFKILGVDNVGEGVIRNIFDGGFKTIRDILSMSVEDFKKLDRFGVRKAQKTFDSIHSKMNDITLSKLQHASGMFENLGSKKLLLLEHLDENSKMEEISKIDGFSDISAENYINGIGKFNEFYEEIKDFVSVKKTEVIETTNELKGYSFVFSGFRNKELEEKILKLGGEVKSSVTKNTTHLVLKTIGEMKSKEVKANKLGTIIMDSEEFVKFLSEL